MSYDYQSERKNVFTEQGVKKLLLLRDNAKRLLSESGAATAEKIMAGALGDSWETLACLDYLVELGELQVASDTCMRQHWIYRSTRS